MNFDSVPAKAEVMRWNPNTLAGFMKKLNMQDCERVVKRRNINGAQFLKMTAIDVQIFPNIHIPIISNILSEINRSEERIGFSNRSKAPHYPQKACTREEETCDSDEFSDSDYEEPSWNEDDSYVCPLSESNADDERGGGEGSDDYEDPPSADTQEHPRLLSLAGHLGGGNYIDSVRAQVDRIPPRPQRPDTGAVTARHSSLSDCRPPRMDQPPQSSFKAPSFAKPPIPQVDRSMKPGHAARYKADLTKSREGSPSNVPEIKPEHYNSANIFHAVSQPNLQPANIHRLQLGQTQGLDPMWYRGQVTRSQAEVALRQVNKDGAFVVRDGSKGSFEQPYTLMVFNQGKVYNVQIRNQDNCYFLGTGHNKTESFPGVKDMISHHTHTPLLLIDAMCPSAQSHCCLLYPVNF